MNCKKIFDLISFSLLLSIIVGCSSRTPLNVCINNDIEIPKKRVVIFLADGMRADLTEKLINQGVLSNIKKYISDRGCTVENGVSTMPSITYASIASIITGQFPGHHNVLGNKWFDRTSGKYQNYGHVRSYQSVDGDIESPTIYELLNDKYSVTIQTAHRRGADRPIDNYRSSGVYWFFKTVTEVDRLVATRFEKIAEIAEQTGQWPDLILAYFPALDEVGHRKGSDSVAYSRAMIHLDTQIGRICEALEVNNLLDDTYLMLISDHGHDQRKAKSIWSPEEFFKDYLELPTVADWFMDDQSSEKWHEYLKDYRVVITNGGTRRLAIHLRSTPSWTKMPNHEEITHFLEWNYPLAYAKTNGQDLLKLLSLTKSLCIVATPIDKNTVLILSQQSSAKITRKITEGQKTYNYEPLEGDPLNYKTCQSTAALIDNNYHTSKEWLTASCTSEYPDFVPQIVEMFDSPRAGQIVAFAAEGWSFTARDHSGHGSVIRQDMIVPFMIAGPDIPHSTIKTARHVDIMPTILELLGNSDRLSAAAEIDGESLVPQMKQISQ